MKLIADMPALERHAIETMGMPGLLLMENAGRQVAEAVLWRVGLGQHPANVLILCGPGQNGGDGLVAARQLAIHPNLTVTVAHMSPLSEFNGDAGQQVPLLTHYPIQCRELLADAPWRHWLTEADVIVDALFGTGLTREITGLTAELVTAVNNASKPVIAVDISSGIDAKTGQALGVAVKATETVTFEAPRPGHVLGGGRTATGKLTIVPIGLPPSLLAQAPSVLEAITPTETGWAIPQLAPSSHKYQRGLVGIITGPHSMPGATQLAVEAAIRSGAGMVAVLGPLADTLTLPPECIRLPLANPSDLADALHQKPFHSLLIGPGLGTDDDALSWVKASVGAARQLNLSLILDADSLTILAQARQAGQPIALPSTTILTPHIGEATRMLGTESAAIMADLLTAGCQLQQLFGAAAVVLKSHSTVVITPEQRGIVPLVGNAGLGTAGSGDVLAGLIAGLAAGINTNSQNNGANAQPLAQVAWVGVLWHGLTADWLAQQTTPQGVTALALAQTLPHGLKHWQHHAEAG